MSIQYSYEMSHNIVNTLKARVEHAQARSNALFREFVSNTSKEIIEVTPYKSGELVRSGGYIIPKNNQVVFYSDSPYSEYLHNHRFKHYTTPGTGPFFISVPMRANLEILQTKLRDLYRRGI